MRRRGFLDQLLVAALGGAVALAQGHDGAVVQAQDLDLDVACGLDEALDEDAVGAEAALGHRLGVLEGLAQFLGVVGHGHADAAAAGGGLDHHRVADACGFLDGLVAGLQVPHRRRR